ncbi:MAG: universal stress protein [Planctomycetales bacterium]
MTVAVVYGDHAKALPLLHWAMQFARARQSDALVLQPVLARGPTKVKEIDTSDPASSDPLIQAVQSCFGKDPDKVVKNEETENGDASDANTGDDSSEVKLAAVKKIESRDLVEAIRVELSNSSVNLLILPRPTTTRSTSPSFTLARRLFRVAHCETMQLCVGDSTGHDCQSILVPSGGGHPTTTALNLATSVADMNDGKVTALYVEPYVDDVAELVGQKIIDRYVAKALGNKTQRVSTQVVLSNNVPKGIALARESGHDLVLLGVAHHGVVHRVLFPSITEPVMMADSSSAVALVRPAIAPVF